MKKVILAGAALALCAQTMHAQISIAPEAGIHLSNLSVDNTTNPFDLNLKNKVGLRAGVNVNFQLGSGLFLQPGLFYTMRGARFTLIDFGGASDKLSFKFNYLELPVNLGYQYNFGKAGALFATAGPYVAFGLSAKTTETVSGMGNPQSVTENLKFGDDVNRLDFGLNFGLGYKIPVGVYVRAQYNLGLSNVNAAGDGTIKHKGFAFTLGYEFNLKHKAKAKSDK